MCLSSLRQSGGFTVVFQEKKTIFKGGKVVDFAVLVCIFTPIQYWSLWDHKQGGYRQNTRGQSQTSFHGENPSSGSSHISPLGGDK